MINLTRMFIPQQLQYKRKHIGEVISSIRIVLVCVFLICVSDNATAVNATWISGDGNYNTATNWDTDPIVPLNNGVTYDVVINGGGTDVTFDIGAAGAVDSLSLGAGVSFITDNFGSDFSSAITTANDATFIAENQSSLNLGGGNLDRSSLIARKGFLGTGGSTLSTSATSWTGTNGFNLDRSFTAEGAGTVLDLSSFATVQRNGGNANSHLTITASEGGRIDLSGISGFTDNVSGINGRINIASRSADSEIDLSGVTTLSNTHIEVRDGGDIIGQLTSLTGRSQLIKRGLDDADGDGVDMIDLSLLTNADNSTLIAEDGATLALGATSIDQADLIARKGFLGAGGATLSTAATSWTGTNGFNLDRSFTAEGAGTVLDLSSFTNVQRNGGNANSHLTITASEGGRIDLSGISGFDDNVSGINGRINIASRSADSEIDLSGVTTLSNTHIEVRDGGDIIGQLTSLTGRSQLIKRGLDDADGDGVDMIDLSLLTNADNSTLIAEDGATLALGATSIDQADLIARKGFLGAGGATLSTAATSWTGTNGFNLDRSFTAEGAGTVLDLSSFATVQRNGGNANSHLTITASEGGRIDLSGISGFTDNVSGINGRINIASRSADSEIDLSGVTTLSNTHIEVRDGGDIIGQLTSLTGRSQLIKRGLDDADGDGVDMIDLSLLTNADNSTLIAEDGATLALGATSIDQADLIARKGFLGAGGATLSTAATSWTGTNGFNLDRSFTAEGAGTVLDLSSFTNVQRNGGNANSHLTITASEGGRIDLSGISGFDDNVSGINGRINIASRSADSEIDLSGVTTLSNTHIEVRDGGDIIGQLTSLTGRSQLIKRGLDDADGDGVDMIDLSMLANADNTTFIAEDGATLALGATSIDQADLIARKGFLGAGGATLSTAATSWTGTNGFNLDRSFTAEGAGTVLDLSSFATVQRNGGNANSHLTITASEGGRIDLSGISGFTDNVSGINGRINIAASSNSEIDLTNVTALSDTDVAISGTAAVDLSALSNFSGGSIELNSNDAAANDLHVAQTLNLGPGAEVEVAGSSAALVVGLGTPSGAADGSLTVTSSGTLSGSGNIIGTLINKGFVAPGNSPGVLAVDGDYIQDANATLGIEIGGLTQGVDFDLLDITGTATLGGTIEVSLFDGFLADPGDSFTFLEADSGLVGTFDSFLCTNCVGIDFELVYGVNFVTLNALAAPVPVPPAVWLFVTGIAAIVSRRKLPSA